MPEMSKVACFMPLTVTSGTVSWSRGRCNKSGHLGLSDALWRIYTRSLQASRSYLAHANCTPFFSPKHLDFVTEKKSFFCHLENTVFQTFPRNALFIRFAHFLLFLGGSNNHSLVQNQRAYRSFCPKKDFVG